ncbi:MAG: metallophosphoesterase [Chloroflexi bacterium]|nr:metallophosphoesterase [Chloroflexota bacterium]
MGKTRIFFTTDVHGSETCFKKFINAGKFYGAQTIILGGDITGKKVVPVVRQSDGTYTAQHLDKEYRVREGESLEAFKKNVKDMGYYIFMTDAKEVEELGADPKKQEQIFKQLMRDRIADWIKIAEERLEGTNIRCYVQPGNDDEYEIDAMFEASRRVINPEGKVVQVDDDYVMVSSGHANITPWHCPRDVEEDRLLAMIEEMANQITDFDHCIFNLHCPPYDTVLDQAPQLDSELRPTMDMGGKPKMVPVGSKGVRRALEKYQPRLGLHGHIHESRGSHNLGKTLCLNPGSEYGEGVLTGVIVDIDKKGIKGFTFTSG